jgi:large subunit ribosomal protein L6
MIEGVEKGYEKTLELVGVGYRAHQSGKGVSLSVMLSHTVEIQPPPGIELTVEGTNLVHVRGADKQAVGHVAAQMRAVRPPNAYTGKGIRYQGQQIKLKPGKSARRALE